MKWMYEMRTARMFELSAAIAGALLLVAAQASGTERRRYPSGGGHDQETRCDPRLYNGAPLADYHPHLAGTAKEPYYDHGPDWGTDPGGSKPVYGIDPACRR